MTCTPDYVNFNEWSDAESHIDRAHEFYERGCWLDALRELNAAIDINPTHSDWLFNKGLTLDTLERYHEALEAYQQAHSLQSNDAGVLNCLAIDYTRVGQYDKALETFEEIEKIDPDFEPAYCNRIITYSELGNHEAAEHMFYMAQQLKDDCPLCYYNIGNSLFARQLYDRAIWCWERTRRLDPHHPQVDGRIAQAYWANGQRRRAKEFFLAELRRHPGDLEILLDTGILLLEMNELDAAREKFSRILEIDPDQAQAHQYLGELQLHQGNITQAVESFNQALRLDAEQVGSNYRLGDCYLQLGHVANAREHLLAELKLSPDNPEVLMDIGCLLNEVGETQEAMQCFERATAALPDDPRGYHNLSLCYYSMGLMDQGMELCRKTLQLDANHIGALHNLAYACVCQKDFANAWRHIEHAYRIKPDDAQLKRLRRAINMQILRAKLTGPFARLRIKTTDRLRSQRKP